LTVCDGDPNLLCNKNLAKKDSENPTYMTTEEQINMMCAQVAHETQNYNAMEEYHKKPVYFGAM
jgi:hypothetical protein